MYRLFFILFCSSFLTACNDTGDPPPLGFPELKVVNSSGKDLLNSENAEAYVEDSISASFIVDSELVDVATYVANRPAGTGSSRNYLLIVDLAAQIFQPNVGGNYIRIDWGRGEPDTLRWVVAQSNSRRYTTKLIDGETEITRLNELHEYFTLIKD